MVSHVLSLDLYVGRFTAELSPCVSTTQRISLAVTCIQEMVFETSGTFWGLCQGYLPDSSILSLPAFGPLGRILKTLCSYMSSPQTLSRKWEKVISPLCAGHRVPTHKLNCSNIARQCSPTGSWLYLRAWNLLYPAQSSFSRPPIARSTVQGSKWTSRGTETSKITQRWDLSVLDPKTGICFSVFPSCCLQWQELWVQTASLVWVCCPQAQPTVPRLDHMNT